MTKIKIPTWEEFKKYALEKKPKVSTDDLKLKYEAWLEAGWKKEKGNKYVPIKIWKTTLLQTLPYIKEGIPKGENPKLEVYMKKPKFDESNTDVVNYNKSMETVKRSKAAYYETKELSQGSYKIYDFLEKEGYIKEKIKNLDERKKEIYLSIKSISLEILENRKKIVKNKEEFRELLKTIEDTKLNKNSRVIIEAKESLLKEYYNTLIVEV